MVKVHSILLFNLRSRLQQTRRNCFFPSNFNSLAGVSGEIIDTLLFTIVSLDQPTHFLKTLRYQQFKQTWILLLSFRLKEINFSIVSHMGFSRLQQWSDWLIDTRYPCRIMVFLYTPYMKKQLMLKPFFSWLFPLIPFWRFFHFRRNFHPFEFSLILLFALCFHFHSFTWNLGVIGFSLGHHIHHLNCIHIIAGILFQSIRDGRRKEGVCIIFLYLLLIHPWYGDRIIIADI